MAEKYVVGKRRKHRYHGRRCRQEWKIEVFGFIAIIMLTAALAAGFIWKAGFAKEQPENGTSFAAELQIGNGEGDTREVSVSDIHGLRQKEESMDAPWYLALVNGQHPIPKDYEPELVEVEGGERVDVRIYDPLMRMLEDAREANWFQLPHVASGYRTAEKQQRLYEEKIAGYRKEGYSENEAEELAGQWVAKPGYSEHQLGFAVDISGATYDVYSWLMENSYKYGFIFRYPGNKTQITGVAEEVWHYRYVGVEAATEIYEQGLCLEEYLGDI